MASTVYLRSCDVYVSCGIDGILHYLGYPMVSCVIQDIIGILHYLQYLMVSWIYEVSYLWSNFFWNVKNKDSLCVKYVHMNIHINIHILFMKSMNTALVNRMINTIRARTERCDTWWHEWCRVWDADVLSASLCIHRDSVQF